LEQDGFVENVSDVVTAGQEVTVRVLSVDLASGKVGLSMKSEEAAAGGGSFSRRTSGDDDGAMGNVQMDANGRPIRGKQATRGGGNKRRNRDEDNTPPAGVKKGATYKGVVKAVMVFGAFVELQHEDIPEGVQGMVHISEIAEGECESQHHRGTVNPSPLPSRRSCCGQRSDLTAS
jgi:predicted RNA-binding protein with RPS1 domain